MPETPRQQSEFNMAVSYLNRLNLLFYAADNASMELDAHGWFHALQALFRELSTEMKPQEEERFEALAKEINEELSECNRHQSRTGRVEIIPELYEKLHNYEKSLRKILKDAGLQNRMVDDFLEPENW